MLAGVSGLRTTRDLPDELDREQVGKLVKDRLGGEAPESCSS